MQFFIKGLKARKTFSEKEGCYESVISDKTFWMSMVCCQSSSKRDFNPWGHLKICASNDTLNECREINEKLLNVDQWNLKL